eukprot:457322-Pyramimonas_sp.AAC.1
MTRMRDFEKLLVRKGVLCTRMRPRRPERGPPQGRSVWVYGMETRTSRGSVRNGAGKQLRSISSGRARSRDRC